MTELPPVGSRVKLLGDGPRWWDVRCADGQFTILTHQAEFKPKGERSAIRSSTRKRVCAARV